MFEHITDIPNLGAILISVGAGYGIAFTMRKFWPLFSEDHVKENKYHA